MNVMGFFAPSPPPLPPPPPPPPQREDPAVAESKKKLRESELLRKGRAASVLTGGSGVLGDTNLARPEAGSETLG